jgi:peptidoglycan/LPS O-acetylase OafA/YrhL
LLDYFSVWPFFLEIGLLLAIAATPLFRAADSPPIPTTNRIGSFDGLRGFLALSVFFHHTAVYHDYLRTGTWQSPSSRFYLLLGPFGVSMFFMITGYLFYSQLLKQKGRPNWKKLYIGRIFRIIPLYWFAVALVVFGVAIHTNWRPQRLAHSILPRNRPMEPGRSVP